MWRRPGKNHGGPSATFNFEGIDKLYVFSSNAAPFEAGTSYDKFAIYTLLEHGGDFAASAKQLLKDGYGEFEPRFRGYGNDNSDTEVNADGQIVSKQLKNAITKNEKVKAYLDENYDVRKNVVTQKLEIKRKDETDYHIMEDADLNQLWLEIDGPIVKNFSTDKIAKMLNLRDYLVEYHPFKSYFESLPPWDGSDHISEVVKMVTPAKGQDDLFKIYFFKWIVAVVASAIEEKENHTCLVFSGDQGIGKTTFFRNLVPPELQDYYKEEQIDPKKNDDKVKITNSFLINLDELDGVTKKENHALKHFMSSSTHDLRMPYAHFSTILKRRASFCGSVNDPGFLGDGTGSRRFLIIDAEDIDYTSPINHEQVYAQAYHLLNHEFAYWLNREEIEVVNKENEKYEKANPAKDLMDKYFEVIPTKDLKNEDIRNKLSNYREYVFYSNTDILDYFKKRHPHIDVWQNALGIELKKRGGERKSMKIDGTTIHGYLLKLLKVEKEGGNF
jgi:predicted P-loop ATPase